jgi:hypothetical protein
MRRIEWDRPLGVLDHRRWSTRCEAGVQYARLPAEVRHAACDLTRKLIPPDEGLHVRLPKINSVRVLDPRTWSEGDGRLKIARVKVCGRRDVVGVRDVHMATSEGVWLGVRVLGMFKMGKRINVLTVYTPMV